jgi:hypothetical protein
VLFSHSLKLGRWWFKNRAIVRETEKAGAALSFSSLLLRMV